MHDAADVFIFFVLVSFALALGWLLGQTTEERSWREDCVYLGAHVEQEHGEFIKYECNLAKK